jgi:glycosyltransferase involved in cell wall biosynthesis
MTRPSIPVSVVIPCFRCGRTIVRAVESVVSQTARPLEILLVDDASDDDTPSVLAELESKYGRDGLRVLRLERNGGPSLARNAGWNAARGEYVAFLDADDSWHPRKLAIQYAYMRDHPDVKLSGHRHLELVNGQALPDLEAETTAEPISLRRILFSNPFVTPSVMVPCDLPLRFREDRRHMEDHLLWMQVAASGARVVRLDAALASTYKRGFGDAGLSAQIHSMAIGDLTNYWILWREKKLRFPSMIGLTVWSLAKFLRRLLILAGRSLLSARHQRTVASGGGS